MIYDVEDLTKKVFNSDAKDILAFGRFGIEKESLRVSQSILSRKQHQQSMGSPLCHRYITTDFSEAQLELITPPLIDKKMGLSFLENIHHFVSHKIEDEIIWPFSMPPLIGSDKDIPIASYGSSNLALFKTTKQKLQSLKKELEKLHPYDVPEIVEINPKSMNKPYLKWLTDSTV